MSEDYNGIFNIQAFEDCFGGDVAFAKELIEVFLKEFPPRMDELKDGISSKNNTKVIESAHSMKGLLVNMGAENIGNIAKKIENMGKTGNLEDIDEIMKEYSVQIRKLLGLLNDYIGIK